MELSLLSDPKCKSSVLCTPVSLLPVAFVINVCIFIFIYKAVPSFSFHNFLRTSLLYLKLFWGFECKRQLPLKNKVWQINFAFVLFTPYLRKRKYKNSTYYCTCMYSYTFLNSQHIQNLQNFYVGEDFIVVILMYFFTAMACALDIGCSNWSLMLITVSL